MSKLQRQTSSQFKCMFFLEIPFQQEVALQEVPRNSEHQKTINSLNHEQCSSMIINNIKIFLQNVCKNKLLTNTILEAQKVIFIQELLWFLICSIPSLSNEDGEQLVGVPNHSNQIIFSRNFSSDHNSPKVISYINVKLLQFHFSLRKDIFNHRDISCVSFFNSRSIYFLVNIYSDSLQIALKYLKDTEASINNILVITGDFNIRNNSWDSSFPHHSIHSNLLINIADSMNLYISKSTN